MSELFIFETEYEKEGKDLWDAFIEPFQIFIQLHLRWIIVFDFLLAWLLFCEQYDATRMTILVIDMLIVSISIYQATEYLSFIIEMFTFYTLFCFNTKLFDFFEWIEH